MKQEQYYLSFIGDNSFAHNLKIYAAQNPNNLKIESEEEIEDLINLNLSKANKVMIIGTLVSTAFYATELTSNIYEWKRSSDTDIWIKTPYAECKFSKSENLTKEQIRKKLEDLSRICN